jgi:hypothetical protein
LEVQESRGEETEYLEFINGEKSKDKSNISEGIDNHLEPVKTNRELLWKLFRNTTFQILLR